MIRTLVSATPPKPGTHTSYVAVRSARGAIGSGNAPTVRCVVQAMPSGSTTSAVIATLPERTRMRRPLWYVTVTSRHPARGSGVIIVPLMISRPGSRSTGNSRAGGDWLGPSDGVALTEGTGVPEGDGGSGGVALSDAVPAGTPDGAPGDHGEPGSCGAGLLAGAEGVDANIGVPDADGGPAFAGVPGTPCVADGAAGVAAVRPVIRPVRVVGRGAAAAGEPSAAADDGALSDGDPPPPG